MPFLIALFGILGAAAFWYYRMKNIGHAAGEIIDVAQTAKGAWNRRQFRKKAEGSVITAIDDPVTGAAVMMVSACLERGPLMPATDAAIQEEMRTVMGVSDPTEPFTYAKWAAERVSDANDVSRKLAKLWMEKLDPDERNDLLAMVSRVMRVEGEHTQQQRVVLQRLRERLGLVTR
jgi:hypothetical protein